MTIVLITMHTPQKYQRQFQDLQLYMPQSVEHSEWRSGSPRVEGRRVCGAVSTQQPTKSPYHIESIEAHSQASGVRYVAVCLTVSVC